MHLFHILISVLDMIFLPFLNTVYRSSTMFFKNACAAALVAFTALLPAASAQAEEEKTLRIVNSTNKVVIWWIYIAPIDQTTWGPYQLKGDILGPGQEKTWILPWVGCWIEVKAVTRGGNAVEKKLNACKVGTWTLHD